jgi:hypothetical protein
MKKHLAKLKVAKAHGKTYICANTKEAKEAKTNQQMVKA